MQIGQSAIVVGGERSIAPAFFKPGAIPGGTKRFIIRATQSFNVAPPHSREETHTRTRRGASPASMIARARARLSLRAIFDVASARARVNAWKFHPRFHLRGVQRPNCHRKLQSITRNVLQRARFESCAVLRILSVHPTNRSLDQLDQKSNVASINSRRIPENSARAISRREFPAAAPPRLVDA